MFDAFIVIIEILPRIIHDNIILGEGQIFVFWIFILYASYHKSKTKEIIRFLKFIIIYSFSHTILEILVQVYLNTI